LGDFVHYEFAGADAGDVVRVEIDTAANVILMDDSGFSDYRSGRRFQYWGGEQRRSPVFIRVPHLGNWHLVIDLGGRAGRFRHSASLIHAARSAPH
jgi:hypothetical protein